MKEGGGGGGGAGWVSLNKSLRDGMSDASEDPLSREKMVTMIAREQRRKFSVASVGGNLLADK